MATQKQINYIVKKACTSAGTIDCTSIMANYGYERGKRRNDEVYFLCPFCGGREDSGNPSRWTYFSINTRSNFYNCFACGEKGGSGKLQAHFMNCSFNEACLFLAYSTGSITEEEFSTATSTADSLKKLNSSSFTYEKIEVREAEAESEFKAPPKVTDLVYRHFIGMNPLNSEGYLYLRNKRLLSDEEIRSFGFFSYEKSFSIDALVESIRREVPAFDYSNLIGVPGFYFEYGKDMKSGWWKFRKPLPTCLAIPIRNSEGYIVAVQFRQLNEQSKGLRYFFLSSKGYKEKGKVTGFGASSGAPVATIYPKEIKSDKVLYIGEGVFKMLELSKDGCVCMSVQGVNNFHYAAEEIKMSEESTLFKSHGGVNPYKNIVIVFDADMYYKPQVLEAAVKAANNMKKAFPDKNVAFLIWNPDLGKGFDDMKLTNNDYKKKLKVITSERFLSIVKESVSAADNMYITSFGINEKYRLTKEWCQLLYNELYINRVKYLLT